MKRFNEKKKVYTMIAVAVALIIGVAYAFLTTNLNIIGNTTVKRNTWDVHFENFAPTPGSVTATSAGIDANETTVNYTVTLQKPGDFYEFTVDVVNEGSIDAMISTVTNTGLTSAQAKYATYSVTYSDGTEVEAKQKLEAETGKEKIVVRVEYKKDITVSDLPETDQVLNLTFSVTYVQADNTAVVVNHPVCKRATTLHTETCSRADAQGCKAVVGDTETISYGSLGATGTLAAGDAFDCDVNGDMLYNSETERFYYVSDLDSNNNYGVLIYYNNVTGGSPDNTTAYKYDTGNKPRQNGPATVLSQLPTTSQWKNVSLSSTTREIKAEDETKYLDFDYSGYAARLLTYGEVASACGVGAPTNVGDLDTCKYLIENTTYSSSSLKNGYWLENPNKAHSSNVWSAHGQSRGIFDYSASDNTNRGARPVIEVLKTKIRY